VYLLYANHEWLERERENRSLTNRYRALLATFVREISSLLSKQFHSFPNNSSPGYLPSTKFNVTLNEPNKGCGQLSTERTKPKKRKAANTTHGPSPELNGDICLNLFYSCKSQTRSSATEPFLAPFV
jgi:hypothetical protein